MYNHQLDTFIVVADSGSFNKAAEALFISPACGHQADQSAGRQSWCPSVYTHAQRITAHKGRTVGL